ncbi:MAG: DUF4410 domain-containing protein, partial [Candidatus Omnitrophica bacterium]|nr:DUF4410 domain-containing protein [Candidatus Omnitrophota bacterium]
SLVKDLNKKGINATRLSSADTLPPEGWIIRGEFLEFQEGDQAQQAVIGLGKGSAKMQARIEVSELGKAGNTPFLIFGSNTSSALRPGAGAMAAINPYAAAAKFVLSKDPSDKEIKKIAAEVASNIEEYLEQIGS